MVKIVFHAIDCDGYASAAIAAKYYAENGVQHTLIGWNYGEPIPEFEDDDKIVLVDVSFPIETMIELKDQLIWIDHHKSAIKDTIEADVEFDGKLPNLTYNEDGQVIDIQDIAACELTWQYFFPDEAMPHAVELLGKYDSFRFDKVSEIYVLHFQYAARMYINSPAGCNQLFGKFYDTAPWIRQGKVIHDYLVMDAKNAVKEYGFMLEIDGKTFLAVNKARFNPASLGVNYHDMGYDGVACFHFDGDNWVFSFYNEDGTVDCSELAKGFGGGGHKGAAGCRMDHNTFLSLLNGFDAIVIDAASLETEEPGVSEERVEEVQAEVEEVLSDTTPETEEVKTDVDGDAEKKLQDEDRLAKLDKLGDERTDEENIERDHLRSELLGITPAEKTEGGQAEGEPAGEIQEECKTLGDAVSDAANDAVNHGSSPGGEGKQEEQPEKEAVAKPSGTKKGTKATSNKKK